MAKITKTYSVDQKIYEAFDQVADEKSINKSSFIEGCINKFLDENERGDTSKVYESRIDSNYTVAIRKEDDTFYYLNDGSKISKILFMQTFKEMEQIDPKQFFNNTIEDRLSLKVNGENQSLKKTGFDGYEKINS